MIPFPTDYPIIPLQQYQYPPFVPDVSRIPQELQNIVPVVSQLLANEITNKAQSNNIRMLHYNIMSSNNWANNDFNNLVLEVVANIRYGIHQRRYRDINAAVDESVRLLPTMSSNALIAEHQELAMYCDQVTLNEAYNTANMYNVLKQELLNFNNSNAQQYGFIQQYPNQQPYQGGIYTNQGIGGVNQQQYPNQQLYQRPQGMNNYRPQETTWPTGNNNQYRAPNMQSSNWVDGNNANQTKRQSFNDSYTTSGMTSYPKHNQVDEPIVEETPKPTPPIYYGKKGRRYLKRVDGKIVEAFMRDNVAKETEMERSKHEIKYFDKTYSAESVVRREQYQQSAEELTVAKYQVIPDETKPDLNKHVRIEPIISSELNIEEALNTATLNSIVLNPDNDDNLVTLRSFTIILNPIFSPDIPKSFTPLVKGIKTFKELADKLNTVSKNTVLGTPKDKDNALIVVSQINRRLTEIVNDYLKIAFNTEVRISSFAEDGGSIVDYFKDNLDGVYYKAILKLEKQVLTAIIPSIEDEEITEILTELQIPEGIQATINPETVSITTLPITDDELGFELDKYEPVLIDERNEPSLYKLACSLIEHKDQAGINTITDILLTRDGVRYRLYKDMVEDSQFYIMKI